MSFASDGYWKPLALATRTDSKADGRSEGAGTHAEVKASDTDVSLHLPHVAPRRRRAIASEHGEGEGHMKSKEFDDDFVRFFSQHLVALNVACDGPGSVQAADAYSCFVLEIGGDCFLVTAGHSLKALYAELPKRTGVRASLFDGWRRDASQAPIPFDLLGAARFAVDEDGLDLGVIHLPPLLVRNLRANDIKPFDEKGWRDPPPSSEMVRYAVIGLPDQFIERETMKSGAVRVSVNPTFVYLEGVNAPDDMKRSFPCFYGKLADNLYNANAGVSLEDMAGFSGGPIIGFSKRSPGDATLRYHLIAVQSAWRRDHRVVVGPLMSVVAAGLEDSIKSGAMRE